jgi:hypothetical protein
MAEQEKRQSLIDSAFDTPDEKRVAVPIGPGPDGIRGTADDRIEIRRRKVPSTIDTLRSELGRGGLPQSNRFQLNINPPKNLATDKYPFGRRLMIRTVSVDLPGNVLETIPDNNIYGPNRNIVQGISYADAIDAKFLMDENFEVHQYFQSWQRLMYDDKTWNMRYYNDYVGTMDIFILNRDHRPTAAFRLWEVYPSTIGSISLDMGNRTPINEFTVSFSFRFWSDIGKYGTKQPTEVADRTTATLQNQILKGSLPPDDPVP